MFVVFFLLAHRLFFCFFLLFLIFSFFLLSYMYFFSLSKVTQMIGVPLVAKQGSFCIYFLLALQLFFFTISRSTYTIITIELFTMDLITCELIYIPIC